MGFGDLGHAKVVVILAIYLVLYYCWSLSILDGAVKPM